MAPARQPADREQIRAAVAARYGGLARAAHAGETVTDCDTGTFAAGCFGAAGYPDATACTPRLSARPGRKPVPASWARQEVSRSLPGAVRDA